MVKFNSLFIVVFFRVVYYLLLQRTVEMDIFETFAYTVVLFFSGDCLRLPETPADARFDHSSRGTNTAAARTTGHICRPLLPPGSDVSLGDSTVLDPTCMRDAKEMERQVQGQAASADKTGQDSVARTAVEPFSVSGLVALVPLG